MSAEPTPSATTPVSVHLTVDRERLLRRFVVAAIGIELLLWLCDATLNHARWIPSEAMGRLFNATREDAMASFFGVMQTLLVALILWWTWLLERASGANRMTRVSWMFLACFFTYLAIDDGTMLHERVGTWFEASAGGDNDQVGWFPSYEWQLIFVPILGSMFLGIAAFLVRTITDLPSRLAVVGAVGLMGVAVVLDFFEGLPKDHGANPYTALGGMPAMTQLADSLFHQSGYGMFLHFSKSTEETIEMMAMTLLAWVFLRHLLRRFPEVHLTQAPAEAPVPAEGT